MKTLILIFSILLSFSVWGIRGQETDSLQKIKKLKVKSVSDLSRLSPFKDVVVIQKRYLPKTFRGEVGLALNGLLNNKFFYSGGMRGQLGFFVQEQFGFGVSGMAFWRAQKDVATDLIEVNGKIPFTNVDSRYYGGGYFKWNPFYGKFAFSFLEDHIIYFDMFFLLGGGVIYVTKGTSKEVETTIANTKLDPEKVNPNVYYAPEKKWWPAGMLGFGQTFALNKDWGLEWNLQLIVYYRRLVHDQDSSKHQKGFTTDMHLSVGVNYYFPGVKYR
ncbi:MAG: outer membrane beta-barrel domain-containing protein [Bdellovibrionales bacterium]|nr:outer membrane beta-barrel domain-containing protein [Bdellovibrionales bacterium]